jgi:hypothetical protein
MLLRAVDEFWSLPARAMSIPRLGTWLPKVPVTWDWEPRRAKVHLRGMQADLHLGLWPPTTLSVVHWDFAKSETRPFACNFIQACNLACINQKLNSFATSASFTARIHGFATFVTSSPTFRISQDTSRGCIKSTSRKISEGEAKKNKMLFLHNWLKNLWASSKYLKHSWMSLCLNWLKFCKQLAYKYK